jgi:16S rRNA (adenine1518-N6/adenine1519-N6)-dimethyltransferase
MPKYLGQHFLKNHGVVKKIVAAIDPQAKETIIEIGSGRGALTIPLAQAVIEAHAKIIAIEKDKQLIAPLIELLSKNFPEEISRSVEVIQGDALIELATIVKNTKATKLVGNIPYYITGHLLRIIGALETKPERCIFMVQAEVAERIAAAPPKMNRLAASVQFWAEPKIIARLTKDDFSPPPEVNSAVILLESRPTATSSHKAYDDAVHALFAQPRKTLVNNLFDAQKTAATSISKETLASELKKDGINPALRPQNLNIADIERIAKHFFEI